MLYFSFFLKVMTPIKPMTPEVDFLARNIGHLQIISSMNPLVNETLEEIWLGRNDNFFHSKFIPISYTPFVSGSFSVP